MTVSAAVDTDRESLNNTQLHLASHSEIAPTSSAPEWIKLIPSGTFRGRDGRGPYTLTDTESVISGSLAGTLDAGLPIDYDHATDLAAPEGRPAPAAGWITALEARDGAIWGQVEWTEQGTTALATREYRYISPVFEHDEDGNIVRILRAALTNNPNLNLSAIASQLTATTKMAAELPASPGDDQTTAANVALGEIARALGLEQSSREAILGRIATLRKSTGSSSAITVKAVRDGIKHNIESEIEAQKLQNETKRAQAETAVVEAMHRGQITPAQREWAIDYCVADRAGFQRFLNGQPSWNLSESVLGERPSRSLNREHMELTNVERAICSRLGIGIEAYVKRRATRESSTHSIDN
jgi:phage I-like protein